MRMLRSTSICTMSTTHCSAFPSPPLFSIAVRLVSDGSRVHEQNKGVRCRYNHPYTGSGFHSLSTMRSFLRMHIVLSTPLLILQHVKCSPSFKRSKTQIPACSLLQLPTCSIGNVSSHILLLLLLPTSPDLVPDPPPPSPRRHINHSSDTQSRRLPRLRR